MQRSKNDVWVGLFVLLGAAALLFLALQSANLLSMSFQSRYRVTAKFDNIGGLKPKAAIKSSGVVVGRVESITFDDKVFQAVVTLALDERFLFPKDSSIKILTSGLLGEQYIGIDPGSFWSQMQGGVDVWSDVGNGVVKSVVFGFTVTFVALLQGHECDPTPEGVSLATTRTVVMASLAVLGLDFVLTAMMFSI